jgi:hypothetical protein
MFGATEYWGTKKVSKVRTLLDQATKRLQIALEDVDGFLFLGKLEDRSRIAKSQTRFLVFSRHSRALYFRSRFHPRDHIQAIDVTKKKHSARESPSACARQLAWGLGPRNNPTLAVVSRPMPKHQIELLV